MYAKGEGIAADPVQAYRWFDLAATGAAAAEARTDAIRNRDLVAARMTSAQIAETRRLKGTQTDAQPGI